MIFVCRTFKTFFKFEILRKDRQIKASSSVRSLNVTKVSRFLFAGLLKHFLILKLCRKVRQIEASSSVRSLIVNKVSRFFRTP